MDLADDNPDTATATQQPADPSPVTGSPPAVLPNGQPAMPQADLTFLRLVAQVRRVAIVNQCITQFHPAFARTWKKVLERPRAEPAFKDYPRASVSLSIMAPPPPAATIGSALGRVVLQVQQPLGRLLAQIRQRILTEPPDGIAPGWGGFKNYWRRLRTTADVPPRPEPDSRPRADTHTPDGLCWHNRLCYQSKCPRCSKPDREEERYSRRMDAWDTLPLLRQEVLVRLPQEVLVRDRLALSRNEKLPPEKPSFPVTLLEFPGKLLCVEYLLGDGVTICAVLLVCAAPLPGDHHIVRVLYRPNTGDDAILREALATLREARCHHNRDKDTRNTWHWGQAETVWPDKKEYPSSGGLNFTLAYREALRRFQFYCNLGYIAQPRIVGANKGRPRTVSHFLSPHDFCQEACVGLLRFAQYCGTLHDLALKLSDPTLALLPALAFRFGARSHIRNHLGGVIRDGCKVREEESPLECERHIANVAAAWAISPNQVRAQIKAYEGLGRELVALFRANCPVRRRLSIDRLEQEAVVALINAATDRKRPKVNFAAWAARRAWRRLHRVCRSSCLLPLALILSGGPSHGDGEYFSGGSGRMPTEGYWQTHDSGVDDSVDSLETISAHYRQDASWGEQVLQRSGRPQSPVVAEVEHNESLEHVLRLLRFLHGRQRRVVELFHGFDGVPGRTHAGVGKIVGLSASRAGAVYRKAMAKLMKKAAEEEASG